MKRPTSQQEALFHEGLRGRAILVGIFFILVLNRGGLKNHPVVYIFTTIIIILLLISAIFIVIMLGASTGSACQLVIAGTTQSFISNKDESAPIKHKTDAKL